MQAHRGSLPCRIEALAQELLLGGLVRAGTKAKLLRIADIPVVSHPTGYRKGDRGKRAKRTDQPWAPEWAVTLAELGANSDDLRRARANPSLRAALESLLRLGGPSPVVLDLGLSCGSP